jgi:hypothetical protein
MQSMLATNLEKQMRILTEDIGVRLAGSEGERQAAKYIADELKGIGADVQVETFDVCERAVEDEQLELYLNGEWVGFPCSLLSNSIGTYGKTVEAPVVFFASATDYQRSDLSMLSGKAVVHLGSHLETADDYRRLVEAQPAFVMFVDVRYPSTVVPADGMFPAYTHAYGMLPIVSVAFLDAWIWQEQGVTLARLRVVGGMRDSTSSNIIAELPGTAPDRGIVFGGAHHDTQAGTVGADDNAVGVAMLLELARMLIKVRHTYTIRLISFGAEEQLSVGSAAYAREHREELSSSGVFMLNFDACGSRVGWTTLSCCGSEGMAKYLTEFFGDHDEYLAVQKAVSPYADHFPFAASGIPAVSVGRANCTSGRFFHHRPDDTMARIDIPTVARLTTVSGEYLTRIAQADPFPFSRQIPQELQIEIEHIWQEMFGGWTGFGGS